MDAGTQFTERYIKMMFSTLRYATPETIEKELVQCRADNRKPVKMPRKFNGFLHEETFHSSTGFDMPVFQAEGKEKQKLILYIHGGAFIYQPIFFHWRFIHDVALRTHQSIMMPIYPKGPEFLCSYSIETLLDFFHNYIEPQGYEQISVIGDSAGSSIAMTIVQEINKIKDKTIANLVMISPCLDLTYSEEAKMRAYQDSDPMILLERIQAITKIWRGDMPADHAWASPVFADLTHLGNVTLYTGSNEVLRADAELLKSRMESIGMPLEYHMGANLFHTYPIFPIPEGLAALKHIAGRLQ